MSTEKAGSIHPSVLLWIDSIAERIRLERQRRKIETVSFQPTLPLDPDEEKIIGLANDSLMELYFRVIDLKRHRDTLLAKYRTDMSDEERTSYNREACLIASATRYATELFRMAAVAYFPYFSNTRAIETIAMRRGWLVVCAKNPSGRMSVYRKNQPLED